MTPSTHTPESLLGDLNDVERKNAPAELYLAGDVDLLRQGSRVSVVGSRKVSELGVRRAAILCKALVEHGIVVVSGLAEGVDRVAHETAMAAGGRTVAVLGTPLDATYPEAHRALQERIVRDHLAVSQFASGAPVRRQNFPQRNRTMALLTDATVIVEAGEKSGTLHQGWEALRLGRPLFLLESVAIDPGLSWTKEMIHYGAQILSRRNLERVLRNLPARSCGEELTF
jgi:DNA processing protein